MLGISNLTWGLGERKKEDGGGNHTDEETRFNFYCDRNRQGITEGGDPAVPGGAAVLSRNPQQKLWESWAEFSLSWVSSFVPACLAAVRVLQARSNKLLAEAASVSCG